MSDPVTHAEIEDVLSSIRRLVSEDGHNPEGDDTPEAEPKPASRLVLTPALRVQQGTDEGASWGLPDRSAADSESFAQAASAQDAAGFSGAAQCQDTPPFDGMPGLSDAALLLERMSAADSLQLNGAPVGATALRPEAPAEPPVTATLHSLNGLPDEPPAPAAGASSTDTQALAGSDAPWVDPGATLFAAATTAPPAEEQPVAAGARAASVVQKIAELEARGARSPEQWEPDGAVRDPFPGAASLNGRIDWSDVAAHTDLSDGMAQDAGPAAETDGVFGGGSAAASVPFNSGADEPYMAEAGISASGLDGAGMAEAAVTEATLNRLGSDAAYHDEDSLRDLVASIVREELQGALGERITRNVRKLVRREIHRALASQDLL